MTIELTAQTAVGQERGHNEDSVLADTPADHTALLAVADGMGGHAAGDVASQLAIDTLRAEFLSDDRAFPPRDAWEDRLSTAMTEANETIRTHGDGNRDRSGMGTTLVAALIEGDTAVVGNVGDSRAYTVTGEEIEQVTVDHSLVQQLVDQGQISQADAADHPQRNVISQSLGTDETVDPDFFEVTAAETLLLCSDGLTEEVTDETISEIVSTADSVDAAADQLVDRANENGGSDNISVVLVEFPE